jgi:hypothetical protein
VAHIDHPERRRYGGRDVWRDAVPLARWPSGFAWVILIGTPSQSDLRHVERVDRDTGRATAFRLCTRNKDDRAYAHTRERGLAILKADGTWIPATPMSASERLAAPRHVRALMAKNLLPILDCDPNVQGVGASPLPISAQEDYMNRWRMGKLAPVEYGVCPRSSFGRPVFPDRC